MKISLMDPKIIHNISKINMLKYETFQFFTKISIISLCKKNIYTSSVLVESEYQHWLDTTSDLGIVYLVLMERIRLF